MKIENPYQPWDTRFYLYESTRQGFGSDVEEDSKVETVENLTEKRLRQLKEVVNNS